MRYAVVIEKTDRNYGAYVLDLPGCIATGATYEKVIRNMCGAIEMHLAGMREDGDPIPPPTTRVEYVDVTA